MGCNLHGLTKDKIAIVVARCRPLDRRLLS